MLSFKDWLKAKEINEVGTSTSCIANFTRIALPLVTRQWVPSDDDEKKKKKKKQD
jgi:hypothetical protein